MNFSSFTKALHPVIPSQSMELLPQLLDTAPSQPKSHHSSVHHEADQKHPLKISFLHHLTELK